MREREEKKVEEEVEKREEREWNFRKNVFDRLFRHRSREGVASEVLGARSHQSNAIGAVRGVSSILRDGETESQSIPKHRNEGSQGRLS